MGASRSKIQGTALLFWKRLVTSCKDTFANFSCKKIGNEQSTRIWVDPWIPGMSSFRSVPRTTQLEPTEALMVEDLISGNQWDIGLLTQLLDVNSVRNILKISISNLQV